MIVSESSIKKKYERFLLEQFLEIAGLSGEIVDDTGEAPDFIVQMERELVGVEITELFTIEGGRAGNLQAQEALAQRIVSHAQRLYVSSGAQHAHVSVHFAPGVDLRTLNRNQTAAALAAFVASQSLSVGQHVQWRQDYASTSLPEAVTYVQMLGVPDPGMAHWAVPRAGWVAPMSEAVLQTSIDEKTALLPKYRERIGTNWLLLVADGSKPSQFFDPPSDAVASAVTSSFARTFYFGRMRRTVLELGVRAK